MCSKTKWTLHVLLSCKFDKNFQRKILAWVSQGHGLSFVREKSHLFVFERI